MAGLEGGCRNGGSRWRWREVTRWEWGGGRLVILSLRDSIPTCFPFLSFLPSLPYTPSPGCPVGPVRQ